MTNGFCRSCGAARIAGDPFCGHCGAQIEPSVIEPAVANRTCPACQTLADLGETFCGACGTMLTPQDAQQATATAIPVTAPVAPVAVTPILAPPTTARLGNAQTKPKPVRTMGIIASFCIAATTIGMALQAYASYRVDTVRTVATGQGEIELANLLDGSGKTLFWLGFIGGAIFFILWEYRAYRNMANHGVQGLRYGHNQTIWPWFVPIFQLWRPLQVINDLWRGLYQISQKTDGSSGVTLNPQGGVPSLLGWWWALWVIGFQLASGHSSSSADGYYVLAFLAFVLAAVSAALAIIMIRKITALHDAVIYSREA